MFKDCEGKIGKVITARIMPDSDLIESIEEICKKRNIQNAYISTCIGSLKKSTFVYALTDTSQYFNLKYSEPVVLTGIIEFLGAQGFISKDDKGQYLTHLHAQFSDEDMRVYGGHILNKGNIVLATMELVINEISDVNIKRDYHEESGFYFLEPEDKE